MIQPRISNHSPKPGLEFTAFPQTPPTMPDHALRTPTTAHATTPRPRPETSICNTATRWFLLGVHTFMHFMHPSPNPRSSSVWYTKAAVVSRISAAGAQWYRTRPSLVHSSPGHPAYTRPALCRTSWAFAASKATPDQL